MTNAMIILNESVKLMEAGVIKATDKVMVIKDGNGNSKELPIPEQIHTFAMWKELGYAVQKGQHAVAAFPIWKYTAKKAQGETEEEAQERGHCFMKMSHFFSASQVQPID